MADTEGEFELGFTNAQKTSQGQRAGAGSGVGTVGSYTDVNSLRTRLAAINGAYYTAARLNGMTKNDMIYAIRVADDPTTIR